ncbi:MAG: sigma-70 family RNA polymerase sigma factor [Verrucomicrobiota bacterium]
MQDFPTTQQPPEPTGIPDAQLLQAWVRHQRQADFTEIVRRHLGLVQGIARRQLDHDLAEDIAQQVFAILARKAASLGDLRSLGAWLHRVTLLQCRTAVRRRMRDRRNQEAAMETARITEARDPLAEALPYLDAAIGDLSDSDRELILLRYSEGLSFSEAATRTGRKEAALRQQTSRALEKLSGMLRRRGVAVPAATLTTGLGLHLAGNSTASAALLVSSTALTNAGGITGSVLAGITFLTMTAKQSIIAGGVFAALLVSGPLVWRATQIHRAEQSLAKIPAIPAPADPKEGTRKSDGSPARPEKTKSVRNRSATTLSNAERLRMMGAIPGIFMANMKQSMNDWFTRDAWMEARRSARTLGLSSEIEKELRDFLIAENTRVIDAMDLDDDEKSDHATRRRERDARIDAWFAAKLTPDQQQARKRMEEARTEELTEKLATSAVHGISANIDLTEEQKSRFYETAAAKVSHSFEEKAYSNSIGLGFNVLYTPPSPPSEEEAGELIGGILDPGQQELWKAAVERDQTFGESMQKRVIGGLFDQLKKIKPTQEEMLGPFEK